MCGYVWFDEISLSLLLRPCLDLLQLVNTDRTRSGRLPELQKAATVSLASGGKGKGKAAAAS
jgi:hypothetical protein